jgi:menaquinone-dependent protoporphyrinogen oxidase
MKILVSAATKHGGTTEIAQAISQALTDAGLEVVVRPPDQVATVEPFDAVVLGSAVYAGHWLQSARELVDRDRQALAARPVWLFSSGPVGDPPKPEEDPADIPELREKTGAREHRVFAGRIERSRLGFAERAIVAALHVPDGDFRPWEAIRTWADGIAAALSQASPASPSPAGTR